jgi:hypothetical protein
MHSLIRVDYYVKLMNLKKLKILIIVMMIDLNKVFFFFFYFFNLKAIIIGLIFILACLHNKHMKWKKKINKYNYLKYIIKNYAQNKINI